MIISVFLKLIRVTIQVLICVYLLGLVWIMWVENRKDNFENDFTKLVDQIYTKEENDGEMAIISSYFAFTTLSTVGLGDLTPVNNDEYILMCVVFILGSSASVT